MGDAMRVLVTGSSGHLGEALVRTLGAEGHDVIGIDVKPSPFTAIVGPIENRDLARRCMEGCEAVLHTATLHKPHVATHPRQEFIDTNITGTLTLLEEARNAAVRAFVLTSTTSVFGDALIPAPGAPAAWITEDVAPQPKNIYGATKLSAEHLCEVFHRRFGLACLILRTSRFFPEPDDSRAVRDGYADANAKANEYLFRRVDLEDVVSAHGLAMRRAAEIGFGRYVISATSPFGETDLAELRTDAPAVVARHLPEFRDLYWARGWTMFPGIDRVYVNRHARNELGWMPLYDFARILRMLKETGDIRSPLARAVGVKGYHDEQFADGPYPVDA
jgi:UDP-glucose 4-epimerase